MLINRFFLIRQYVSNGFQENDHEQKNSRFVTRSLIRYLDKMCCVAGYTMFSQVLCCHSVSSICSVVDSYTGCISSSLLSSNAH